jgi:hypothetical protein
MIYEVELKKRDAGFDISFSVLKSGVQNRKLIPVNRVAPGMV